MRTTTPTSYFLFILSLLSLFFLFFVVHCICKNIIYCLYFVWTCITSSFSFSLSICACTSVETLFFPFSFLIEQFLDYFFMLLVCNKRTTCFSSIVLRIFQASTFAPTYSFWLDMWIQKVNFIYPLFFVIFHFVPSMIWSNIGGSVPPSKPP